MFEVFITINRDEWVGTRKIWFKMWIAWLRRFGDFWSWEDAEAHIFRGYDVFSSIYLWLNYKYEETADMHSYLTSPPDENIDGLWKINGLIINTPLLY